MARTLKTDLARLRTWASGDDVAPVLGGTVVFLTVWFVLGATIAVFSV